MKKCTIGCDSFAAEILFDAHRPLHSGFTETGPTFSILSHIGASQLYFNLFYPSSW